MSDFIVDRDNYLANSKSNLFKSYKDCILARKMITCLKLENRKVKYLTLIFQATKNLMLNKSPVYDVQPLFPKFSIVCASRK